MKLVNGRVLLVEDSDDDFTAFVRAVRKLDFEVELSRTSTVEQTREWLSQALAGKQPWPAVVFLDLNLPGTDGRVFLRELKSSPQYQHLPVVIYSTSAASDDVRGSYADHANAYHQKPLSFAQMKVELAEILRYWTHRTVPPHA